ncbi:MAG: BatA and WFA domain-containing protein [Sandaracinus sp.]
MGLLSPISLAWLGLLAPLVALYILRRRREARLVGSTMLWDRAVRDMRAERPWQRLIPYVSLILQALAIVLAAVALARPSGVGEVPSGARIAVVVDASASMATRDLGGGSRMEAARAAVVALADALPPGGTLTLIEAASEPAVLLAPTSDVAEIRRAIGQLRVRGAESSLEAAVSVAAERVRDAPPGSRIVVLTDASSEGEQILAATVPVEVQRVGMDAVNDAIVAVDVRARPTDEAPDRAELFVRIVRHATTPATRWITASIEGRGVVASRRVELTPEQPESVLMLADLPPDAEGRAALVRLELAGDDPAGGRVEASSDDALSLDDLVVAPSPGARRLTVFLVGSAPS